MRRPRLEPERLAAPGSLTEAVLLGTESSRTLFPPATFEVPGVGSHPDLPKTESPLSSQAFRTVGSAASERLDAVLRGEGFVVTTGQQPQLFGGPLYVLYKILTAIRTAIETENALGVACLAVFWVASDDHDWREVASMNLLNAEEELVPLVVGPPSGWRDRPVGPAPLPPEIEPLLETLEETLSPSEQGRVWVRRVAAAYRPGRSFSEAFVDLLDTWLTDLPVAFLDSAEPELRRASVSTFRQVLGRHAEVVASLERGTRSVGDVGFDPQLAFLPGASPIFRDGPEGRKRLYVSGPLVVPGGHGEPVPLNVVLEELETEPERFSPAAALRPVLESLLLPVSATVLGPGEIAYWAQLHPLFEALRVPMPRIRPRTSWRIIEPKVDRLLDRTGLSAPDLRDGGRQARRDLVERKQPAQTGEAIRSLEASLTAGFSRIEEAAADELPGLRSAVGKARSQVDAAMDDFRKTVDARVREREHILLDQARRAARNLYPGGVPQERVVSPLAFLARYGEDFLEVVRSAHSV